MLTLDSGCTSSKRDNSTARTIVAFKDVEEHTAEYVDRFANPMVAAERGYIDDIIEPRDTRRVVCDDLNVLRGKKMETIPRKHSNIPL